MRRYERPFGHAFAWAISVAVLSVGAFGVLFEASASDRPAAAPAQPGPAPTGDKRLGPEVVEERTRNSKTFADADGRGLVTRMYPGAVHFKDARGEWLEIHIGQDRDGAALLHRGPSRFGDRVG